MSSVEQHRLTNLKISLEQKRLSKKIIEEKTFIRTDTTILPKRFVKSCLMFNFHFLFFKRLVNADDTLGGELKVLFGHSARFGGGAKQQLYF